MSKECIQVKATDIIELLYDIYGVPSGICEQIKNMVQRLKSIDNAKPSGALKDLDKMANQVFQVDDEFELYYDKVKQALIKAQEQEKVLDIIKKKNVDVCELKICIDEYDDSLYQYNKRMNIKQFKLIEEEFDLLKRWLG